MKFTQHPVLKPPTPQEIQKLCFNEDGTSKPEGLKALIEIHRLHEEAIENAEADPLNFGITLEGWKYADSALKEYDTLMCFGGNRCLSGEQEVWDPVAKKSRRIDKIDGDFHVLSYDESTYQVVPAAAQAPFRKPAQDLFRVQLSNGEDFHCSKTHLARSFGSYLPIADAVFLDAPGVEDAWSADLPLCDGFHLLSTVDIGLLASQTNAHRLWKTVQDSQCDCRLSLHSDDGRLLASLDIDPNYPPSLSDALERMGYAFDDLDGRGNIPPHSRLCLQFDLLSNRDDPHQIEGQFVGNEYHASCIPCKSTSQLREDQEWMQAHQQSIVEFSHRLQSSVLSGSQGILWHYVYSSGGNRSYFNQVVKCDFLRNDTVWDFTVPGYHNYFIGETLHHNSGKTEYGARSVVKAALENPNSIIVCFAQDADASIRTQQSAIWRYLPPEIKDNKKKSELEYINYKVKTGFSGQSLILPNGSQILFHTYSQFIANRAKFEGLELGSRAPLWHNIGLWLDEYLEDGDLVRTMRFRLATRDAKMLLTFTPIDGYTPFVAEFLKGAETKKTRKAVLVNNEEVPVVQYSPEKDAGIVYFHSEFNPFGGYERIAKELKHSPKNEILTRAYGIPVKSMTSLFPLFSPSVHVTNDLPKIGSDTHTVYQVLDPADARNFVSLWAAVDSHKRITILREWPDRDTYGEWAIFGDPKWKFGPAADKLGYAIKTDIKEYSYVQLFRDIESELGVEVFERIGDSRFMATEHDNQDMFTDFAEKGMDFIPSAGSKEDVGIQLLDQWFTYNPNVEIDSANRPQISIHSSCKNLIYSIVNYSPEGKKAEPLKDFIDCLRYLRTTNGGEGPEHYAPDAFTQSTETGGY